MICNCFNECLKIIFNLTYFFNTNVTKLVNFINLTNNTWWSWCIDSAYLNNVLYYSIICLCSIINLTFTVWSVFGDIHLTCLVTYTSRQCVFCIIFHCCCCVSLVQMTYLCTFKRPAIVLLFYQNAIMLLFYYNSENSLNDKIILYLFLCDVYILTSNTRLYTRIDMNLAIQSQNKCKKLQRFV